MKLKNYIWIILCMLVVWLEYKDIYVYSNQAGTKFITVWKVLGNKCYLIPGKYHGIFRPFKDYIIVGKTNSIIVIWPNIDRSIDFTVVDHGAPYEQRIKTVVTLKDTTCKYVLDKNGTYLIPTMDFIKIDLSDL